MQQLRGFPRSDHPTWTKDLAAVPCISEDVLDSLCDAKAASSRQSKKSYCLAIEAYCSPSSLLTNTCDSGLVIFSLIVAYASARGNILAPVKQTILLPALRSVQIVWSSFGASYVLSGSQVLLNDRHFAQSCPKDRCLLPVFGEHNIPEVTWNVVSC